MEPSTLLLVDDAPENIKLLSALLRPHYRLKAATNGEKALQLASTEPRPDLILLDVMMPGMDGHEVCRRLKADAATRGIPIIFLSGKDSAEDEQAGLALGAADYLSKPIDPALLAEKVALHLRECPRAS